MYYASNYCFQPISYGVVLWVFGLMSLGPGTRRIGLGHLSLDNKCAAHWYKVC